MKKTEDHIPVYKISGNLLLMRNGDYAVGYKLQLPEIYTLSETELQAVHALWASIVKSMPDNCVLHKQDWFISETYKADYTKTDVIERSVELHFNERNYIRHEAYLFVIKTGKNLGKRGRSGSSLYKTTVIRKEITDDGAYDEFMSFTNSIVAQFEASRVIECTQLEIQDYITEEGRGLINQYINLDDNGVMTDLEFKDGFIISGHKKASIFSMGSQETLPDETFVYSTKNQSDYPFSWMYNIGLGLKVPHIYNQVVFKENHDVVYNKLNNKRKGMASFSKSSPENRDNSEKIDQFLTEVNNNNKTIVRFHANILVWDEDESRLKKYLNETSAALKGLGFVAKEERVNLPYLHWAGYPGAAAGEIPVDLTSTMEHDQAAAFFTSETNYSSSASDYGIKMIDRLNRTPILVDFTKEPFKKGVVMNMNAFLVGSSGAGKSFLVNRILYNHIKAGHHVVIGDIGGSYRRAAKLLGEKAVYLEHTDETPLTFNPFYIKSLKDLHREKLRFILQTIFTCAGLKLDEDTTQEAIMEKLLLAYYNEYIFKSTPAVFPCMDSFYVFMNAWYKKLQQEKSAEVKYVDFERLKINLEKFTTGGDMQYLLNARTNYDLMGKQMIVFDLETVKDDKMLFTLVTLMIMSTMIDKMFRMKYEIGEAEADRIIKTLLLDEAWKALMNENMAAYTKYAVKTFRKHNAQIFFVTQEPNDLMQNPTITAALISNTPTRIFGDMSGMGAMADEIYDIFSMPTNYRNIIKTLNKEQKHGEKQREYFVQTGNIGRVYASVATPEELALFSTTKEVSGAVDRLVNKFNGDVNLAISEYVLSGTGGA